VRRCQNIAGDVTRQCVDPAGHIDREDGSVADIGRVPGAVEPGPVGGVDHEVCVRQQRWMRRHVEDANAHTLGLQMARRDPAVGAVVALAIQHVDGAAVGTTDVQGSPGNSGTAAINISSSTGTRRRSPPFLLA
jgi:hypothetical protein